MPLNWDTYEQARGRFERDSMGEQERLTIEAMVAELLNLSAEQRACRWGEAIGYGFYAAVVLRIPSQIHQGLHGAEGDLAVKVFKSAQAQFVNIQRTLFLPAQARLPGVQRTLAAGVGCDGRGQARGYLVLQYIDGQPLDHYLQDHQSLSPVQAGRILASLLKDVLIPVWSEGYRFWDFRGANLIVNADSGKLTMIDTDALRISLLEAAAQSPTWARRDEHERLALEKLPHSISRVVLRQGRWRKADEGRVRTHVREALQGGPLPMALHALGRQARRRDQERIAAIAAVDRLLADLADRGLRCAMPALAAGRG